MKKRENVQANSKSKDEEKEETGEEPALETRMDCDRQ